MSAERSNPIVGCLEIRTQPFTQILYTAGERHFYAAVQCITHSVCPTEKQEGLAVASIARHIVV